MELPPVLLFETPGDPTARQVAVKLLPKLKDVGYGVLCVEMPENLTDAQIIEHTEEDIRQGAKAQFLVEEAAAGNRVSVSELNTEYAVESLLQKFINELPNKKGGHRILANKFCQLEANKEMLKVLELAKKCGFLIKGIDSDPNALDKSAPSKNLGSVQVVQDREQTMSDHIENLRQRGVIYICNADCAVSLIKKCNDIFYFYPRATKAKISELEEDGWDYRTEAEAVMDPSELQVISEKGISSFADRIVTKILE